VDKPALRSALTQWDETGMFFKDASLLGLVMADAARVDKVSGAP
jgi:hypothetical protein